MTAKKVPEFSAVLKWVVFATIVVVAFILVIGVNITAANNDANVADNKNLTYFQSFSLARQDGGDAFTQDDMQGYTITVFNGWGPWCHNCVEEMPALQAMSAEYAEKGLLIVGVVADYYTTSTTNYGDKVQKVVDSLGITYPVVLADETFSNEVQPLMANSYPGTWAVDSNGNVIDYISGGRSEQAWRDIFDRWLAGETWTGA